MRDADVAVLACRDAHDRQRLGRQPLPPELLVVDRDDDHHLGIVAATEKAVAFLTRDEGPTDGFWIHLDADLLDETIMHAVDDPQPDGLTWDELTATPRIAVGSGHPVGLETAIYNPAIDHDRSNGRGLAASVQRALVEFSGA